MLQGDTLAKSTFGSFISRDSRNSTRESVPKLNFSHGVIMRDAAVT